MRKTQSILLLTLLVACSSTPTSWFVERDRGIAATSGSDVCAVLVQQILSGDNNSNKYARELLPQAGSYDEFITAVTNLDYPNRDWLRRELKKNKYVLTMGLSDSEYDDFIEMTMKYGSKNDEYKDRLNTLLHGMDKELDVMKERNQCNTGTCWIQTGSSVVEMGIRAEGGVKVTLSDSYLFAQHAQTQIMHNLVRPSKPVFKDGRAFKEGGAFHQVFQYLKGRGAIPDESWKPAQDIYNKEVKEEFYGKVNKVIDSFFAKKTELDKTTDAYKEMKKETEKELRAIFKDYINLPKKVEFNGKEYTPEEWAEEFIKPKEREISRYLRDFDEMSPEQRVNNKAEKSLVMRKGRKLEEVQVSDNIVGQKEFEAEIVKRIDIGKSVYLSFNSAGKSEVTYKVASNNGEIEVPYRNLDSRLMTFNANQIGDTPHNGDHAVLITGYKRDAEGRISRLQVQNTQRLSAGRHTMTREFFLRFANQIQFFD